jgi:hypothetical protein
MISKNRKKILKEKKEYIEMQIQYEDFPGFFTLHKCPNCENSCRSEKCIMCWKNDLEKIDKQLKDGRTTKKNK